MAGTKVNNYTQLNSDILEMQLTLDQTRKGMYAVSLTNYDSTGLPAIAAGSVLEINGALYKFASEEVILDTEGVSDGQVFIYIDPSTITAEFTNTAPTWSDSKNGWYGTTTKANCKYISVLTKTAAVYTEKQLKPKRNTSIRAQTSALVELVGAGTKQIPFAVKTYDYNSELDAGTGIYTALESGFYRIQLFAEIVNAAATNGSSIAFYKNGSWNKSIISLIKNTTRPLMYVDIIYLMASETISFYIGTQQLDVTTQVTVPATLSIEKIYYNEMQ